MPTSPSYGHATPRARTLPEPLDLAPHLLLFPKPKEKRLRVLQMLCCLTSDRLWLCGCVAVQEPNPEEVCEVRWMSQDEVSAFCAPDATHGEQIACWFAEIENLVRPPNLPLDSRLPVRLAD